MYAQKQVGFFLKYVFEAASVFLLYIDTLSCALCKNTNMLCEKQNPTVQLTKHHKHFMYFSMYCILYILLHYLLVLYTYEVAFIVILKHRF